MSRRWRILSWNVNGIRAIAKKDFLGWLHGASPDIIGLQETRAALDQIPPELREPVPYRAYWHPAERGGYSGVAILSREEPLEVRRGIGEERFDTEGRVISARYKDFTLINIYFPNGGRGEDRLRFKLEFYEHALKHFKRLEKAGERLVVCGDYNTAHHPIDLANPDENEDTSGFMPVEREWLDRLVAAGYIDTFRQFHQEAGQYTWWDMRTRARERNAGWRIDYHFVSSGLKAHLKDAVILPEVQGSDHCPVGITLEF
ncbi:MAG: Exodeoxyribonuclease [Candidatus Omnitrophica bacterium]|nr:Exodeoxyribonuclease [Candidatus Omnitrophota bacterium]